MRCNYRPPKLSKEDRQELASLKSTLPYIDRMQIEKRKWCEVDYYDDNGAEVESDDGDIHIGDRVGTTKGRGIVSVVDNDIVTVERYGDHGIYCFSKDSVWKIEEDREV